MTESDAPTAVAEPRRGDEVNGRDDALNQANARDDALNHANANDDALDHAWPLVLASASPARLATLRAAGVHPHVQVSAVDEEALLALTGVTDPEEVALLLAKAKAEDVAAGFETDAIVLGCDSVLDLDGVALGKPVDAADAVQRWRQMRGRTGHLRTGHWLIDLRSTKAGESLGSVGGTSSTTVHFADVSDEEIAAYVATGEPLHVAGAFTIDGLGGAFITGIEGDHHGVVGVSLPLLRDLLGSLGVSWPALWRNPA